MSGVMARRSERLIREGDRRTAFAIKTVVCVLFLIPFETDWNGAKYTSSLKQTAMLPAPCLLHEAPENPTAVHYN